MKNNSRLFMYEKAQMLPIIVIGVLAMIALGALILDGGLLLANRRAAQAAADAGALAGARQICLKTGNTAAIDAARNYAIKNRADPDPNLTTASVSPTGVVSVRAVINQGSWFARIFNQDALTSSAVAEAGCFNQGGKYVLPLAWSCRPPANYSDSADCNWLGIDWETTIQPARRNYCDDPTKSFTCDHTKISNDLALSNFNDIYIIMDAVATGQEIICKDSTHPLGIDCDLNNDERMDIEGNGNRSWVDLDGKNKTDSCKYGGKSELECWILEGFDDPLDIHMWLSSEPGNTGLYDSVKTRIGDVVRIPVFNQTSSDYPTSILADEDSAHMKFPLESPYTDDVWIEGTSKTYFHIVGFANFYVTCVHTKQKDSCPGYNAAIDSNPLYKNKVNTVEGYFVNNLPPALADGTSSGVDLGNYIISLIN